jgi:hypothetical protein
MTRKSFEGMLNILVFNWPLYGISLLVTLLCITVVRLPLPFIVKLLLLVVAASSSYFFIVSLVAAFIIYDWSPLYRWMWLKEVLPTAPRRIVNLHAGLDETSPILRLLFPNAELVVLDFYAPQHMTEPSIAQARRLQSPQARATSVRHDALPLPDCSCSAVLLFLSAHEIRDAQQRLALFHELERILEKMGTVLLVEHNRNLANLLAFGPGVFHFYPQAEWLRVAMEAGLRVARISSCTPFISIMLLQKEGEL